MSQAKKLPTDAELWLSLCPGRDELTQAKLAALAFISGWNHQELNDAWLESGQLPHRMWQRHSQDAAFAKAVFKAAAPMANARPFDLVDMWDELAKLIEETVL